MHVQSCAFMRYHARHVMPESNVAKNKLKEEIVLRLNFAAPLLEIFIDTYFWTLLQTH